MRKIQLFIPVLILLILLAALIGHKAYGQQKKQIQIKKTIRTYQPENGKDSVKVIVTKVINSTHSGNVPDIDSLFLSMMPSRNMNDSMLFRLMCISGKDTLITNVRRDSLNGKWIENLNSDSLLKICPGMTRQFKLMGNSVLQLSFDELFDPMNFKDIMSKTLPYLPQPDSLMHKNVNLNLVGDSIDQNMIVINDDGKYLRIEKNGEIVLINKEKGIKHVNSDIQVVENEKGEKEIVLQTRILLDNLNSSDKKELKSKGVKTNQKEPDFEFIRFYPNPSYDAINISFLLNEKADTEIKIINMIGQTVYEEKLKDFQGEYNQSVDVKQFGKGNYILQIIHGNRAVTRKIIVE